MVVPLSCLEFLGRLYIFAAINLFPEENKMRMMIIYIMIFWYFFSLFRTLVILYLTKKTQELRNSRTSAFFFLAYSFMYRSDKIFLNANIWKTQIFDKVMYDLKGQLCYSF